MYRQVSITLAILWAASLWTAAGAARAEDPSPHPLAALGWVTGGVWVAQVETTEGPQQIEVSYRWLPHQRGIAYDIAKTLAGNRTPTHHGVFYWHPGRKEIAMLEVDYLGGVVEAWTRLAGDRIINENVATSATGEVQRQRAEARRTGEDAFDFTAWIPRKGEWVEVVKFHYQRRPSP